MIRRSSENVHTNPAVTINKDLDNVITYIKRGDIYPEKYKIDSVVMVRAFVDYDNTACILVLCTIRNKEDNTIIGFSTLQIFVGSDKEVAHCRRIGCIKQKYDDANYIFMKKGDTTVLGSEKPYIASYIMLSYYDRDIPKTLLDDISKTMNTYYEARKTNNV